MKQGKDKTPTRDWGLEAGGEARQRQDSNMGVLTLTAAAAGAAAPPNWKAPPARLDPVEADAPPPKAR